MTEVSHGREGGRERFGRTLHCWQGEDGLCTCVREVYAPPMKPIGCIRFGLMFVCSYPRTSPPVTWIRAFLLLLVTSGLSAEAANLEAGLAKVDITPTQPVKMAGYESRKDFSQGVHDPLGARALALQNEGKRLVLVSIDSLGFYNHTAEPLWKAILEKCHLQPSELFLCAIHTHSAPTLTLEAGAVSTANLQYTESLSKQLTELVSRALQELKPVQVSLAIGSSPVGVNRREVSQDNSGKPKIVLGRNPGTLTDREVQVLKLTRPGRQEAAGALFAYATHSTSLGPKNYLVSGDIHGIAEQFVDAYFGNGFVAPGFAGASGNIDPWVRVLPDFRTNNGWIPEPVLLGTLLGEEVARLVEGVQSPVTNGVLQTAFETVSLPGKQSSDIDAPGGATTPFNITVARLGDVAFVGWGGEVFNEVGKTVKTSSPFRCTFIFTHCNGAAGYVPIRSSYAEGGYEVQSSPFGAGADEALAQATLKMLRALHDPKG